MEIQENLFSLNQYANLWHYIDIQNYDPHMKFPFISVMCCFYT